MYKDMQLQLHMNAYIYIYIHIYIYTHTSLYVCIICTFYIHMSCYISDNFDDWAPLGPYWRLTRDHDLYRWPIFGEAQGSYQEGYPVMDPMNIPLISLTQELHWLKPPTRTPLSTTFVVITWGVGSQHGIFGILIDMLLKNHIKLLVYFPIIYIYISISHSYSNYPSCHLIAMEAITTVLIVSNGNVTW